MARARTKRRWDRYAIKAAVHRRGKSLTDLAVDAGLEPAACRVALIRRHVGGEQAIAGFLGIDARALWPERYRSSQDLQGISNPPERRAASPIGEAR